MQRILSHKRHLSTAPNYDNSNSNHGGNGTGGNGNGKGKSKECAVLEIIEASVDLGDPLLLLAGLHENMFSTRFHDPDLGRASLVLDSMADTDILDHFTRFVCTV